MLFTTTIIFFSLRTVFSQEQKFPEFFKFGTATAAYQIEGAWNEEGKGASIWDTFTHNRSHLIADKQNADIACDSYHRYEEDIEHLKNLGVQQYRISLAWTRIIPDGISDKINQPGVDYYNNLIDKLLENNIEPIVTLFHWDLPQKFAALGGWTNSIVIQHYANYARKAFQLFGDRVKIWITINEPRLICQSFKGLVPDITSDYPLGIVEYQCNHNILKAHAEAYHIYDKEFRAKQNGKISITIDITWTEPANSSNPEDVKAAQLQRDFNFGIYAHPIFKFDYPKIVIDRMEERQIIEKTQNSRLPKFTRSEKLMLSGTYDFFGINHYITNYARARKDRQTTSPNIEIDAGGEVFFDPNWKGGAANWIKFVPWGLRKLLNYVKKTYRDPDILITENGFADAGDKDDLNDDDRIHYYKVYLNATLQAILEDNVKVKSYMAWSLMDNFEWTYGYTLRFGLYHVNFTHPNRTRTPKKSVEVFRNIIKTRTIT